ncbi:LOW QUALITY PROTEIN: Hypothetical protein PHPALM_164 [Phytophthora palmivora]|uniref:PiggyBac transposable element-derived protein domain-containing protein n=1 Tax=Phytophthora palmivora TaxID=4796 RepID=A0A2P4YVI4_9STRA|nr:LOW QUALITY PROTEIN: Hypothetical protein PHPALM_164 [Phytophthora palmivora]
MEELPESVCSSAAKDSKYIKTMRDNGLEYDETKFGPDPTYADLYDGTFGPTQSVLVVADDPLALLFYFMPPNLWAQIARKSGGEVEALDDIQRRLEDVKDICAYEVLQVMSLLIARMLAPIRKGIAAHWSVANVGAMPANRFSLFMSKNRFFHIMGYLQFSNNKSPKANTDRAWKIRPVIDVLQRTFARGYRVPPVISFDETTLPSHTILLDNPTKMNPTRGDEGLRRCMGQDIILHEVSSPVASFDSPRFFMPKIEVYCGAKEYLRVPVAKDNNSDEAAVLRNMNELCPPSPTSPWRLVVTDRFYTSVKLALELLHRRMYLTGTIQTDRSGYAKDVITKKKTRIVNKQKVMAPPQGTTKLAENKRFPQLTAVMWMDRLPVHMLSTGGSRRPSTVSTYASSVCGECNANFFTVVYPKVRRVHGEMKAVPAPELVRDYHR